MTRQVIRGKESHIWATKNSFKVSQLAQPSHSYVRKYFDSICMVTMVIIELMVMVMVRMIVMMIMIILMI